MTSRELVIRTLNHEPAGRVPRDLWLSRRHGDRPSRCHSGNESAFSQRYRSARYRALLRQAGPGQGQSGWPVHRFLGLHLANFGARQSGRTAGLAFSRKGQNRRISPTRGTIWILPASPESTRAAKIPVVSCSPAARLSRSIACVFCAGMTPPLWTLPGARKTSATC